MAEKWELSYGCHWNSSLGHFECHGLNAQGRIRCSHYWHPGHEDPTKREPNHHPKCPIGKMMEMKKRVREMKVVVDEAVAPTEIRVSDPLVAEWLQGDGDAFRERVYKEAGYCVGHHSNNR